MTNLLHCFLSVVTSLSSASFIPVHSFIPAISIAPLQVLSTQRRSRLQHGYCIGVSRRSAQATAGKGLAQGPSMALERSRTHDPTVESYRLNQDATLSHVVEHILMHSFKLLFSVSLLVVPVLSLYTPHIFLLRPF